MNASVGNAHTPIAELLLVLVAHKPLASGFFALISHVFGESRPQVLVLDVEPEQSAEEAQAMLAALRQAAARRAGVLVMVDMVGASPYHLAMRMRRQLGRHGRMVTGLNGPMVLSAASMALRGSTLDNLAFDVAMRARRGVRLSRKLGHARSGIGRSTPSLRRPGRA